MKDRTTTEASSPPAPGVTDHQQRATSSRKTVGIKTKLILAFCFLAALNVLASGVAWYVFANIDTAVTRVTAESIPRMVSSLKLAETSAEIATTAPSLMASITQEERESEQARLERKAKDLFALINGLSESDLDTEATTRLTGIEKQMAAELRALNAAVETRLLLKTEREAAAARLSAAHVRFLLTLTPLVDDAAFDVVMAGEGATAASSEAIGRLVEGGVNTIHRLLTIQAEANLAAGLLAQAALLAEPAQIQPVRERFLTAVEKVERALRQLPDTPEKAQLDRASKAMLLLGTGTNNLFDLRVRELRADHVERTYLEDAHRRMAFALRHLHERLLGYLTPMVDAAGFNLVMASESVAEESTSAITDLIECGISTIYQLLMINAEGNLAAGLLSEAAQVNEPARIQPIRERFLTSVGQIERIQRQLPESAALGSLRSATSALLSLGTEATSIFDLRRRELRQMAMAQSSLEASRALAFQMGEEVSRLVANARQASDLVAEHSAETIGGGKALMLVITAVSLTGAALAAFFFVIPRVVRPLERITDAMSQLAAGDTTVDIPGRDRTDEIGHMAHALGVFRDTAVEVQQSNLREIREGRRRLTAAIESITEGFSLYDRDDRLVVCNSRYRTLLYPGLADEIVPGATFESTIRQTAEQGHIEIADGRVEEWIQERLARHRQPGDPHIQRRQDGRWILVSERKTDEGGTVAVYSDITDLKQREQELAQKSMQLEQLSNQLAKYLSPQVYESIFSGRQEVRLTSHRKKLTVFFSDIAGFTEIADTLESEELTALLNEYLTEMSQIALAHGATIDKYVGDAIVIFYGDPESEGVKEDALACSRMALAMQTRLVELEEAWRNSGIEKPLKCRIGINTGFCTVGNFGSEDRMDYTIIGGGVNLASRLESEATPGQILTSYETYALIKDEIHCEPCGQIKVKGIAHPVSTYRMIDTFQNLMQDRRFIHEDHPNLRIDLDLNSMSEVERGEAETVLRRTLSRLTSGADPRPDGKDHTDAGSAHRLEDPDDHSPR